ncbi:hypothetical protein HK096_008586 [Nowakowskiella sp. JEL0078]|nr:hypothetical protein HK096_008586 [Nowakowskiella sp. JEL0078]
MVSTAGESSVVYNINDQAATTTSDSTSTSQESKIPMSLFLVSGAVFFAIMLVAGTLVYNRRRKARASANRASESTVGWGARLANMKNGSLGDISLQPVSEKINSPYSSHLTRDPFERRSPTDIVTTNTPGSPTHVRDYSFEHNEHSRKPSDLALVCDGIRGETLPHSHTHNSSESSQATAVFPVTRSPPTYQTHFNPALDPNTPPVAPPPSMPVPPTPKSPGRVVTNPFGAQMEALATIQRAHYAQQAMSPRLAQSGYVNGPFRTPDGGVSGSGSFGSPNTGGYGSKPFDNSS